MNPHCSSVSISDLVSSGTWPHPHEAVAIVQQVAQYLTWRNRLGEPMQVPPLEDIRIDEAGEAVVTSLFPADDGDIEVAALANLLNRMLPQPGCGSGIRVPGALRLCVARGLNELDVPPYSSSEEFCRSLARFERAPRIHIIAELFERWLGRLAQAEPDPRAAFELVDAGWAAHPEAGFHTVRQDEALGQRQGIVPQVFVERRAASPRVDTFRLFLREADEQLFELRHLRSALSLAAGAPTLESERPAASRRRRPTLIAIAALLAVLAVPGARRFDTWTRADRSSRAAKIAPGGSSRTPLAPASSTPADPVDQIKGSTLTTGSSDRQTKSAQGRLSPVWGRDAAAVRRETRLSPPGALETPPSSPLIPPAVAENALGREEEVFSPSFAQNGSAVFFHAGRDADARLMRADTAGDGHILQVTQIVADGAKNYHVQVSPDGESIAFDSDRDGLRAVYVAGRDGTHVRKVSGEGYAAVPSWTPDGSRLAFIRAEEDRRNVWNLWLLELHSGALSRLTSHAYGQPWGGSWFPDSRRICYSHEDRLIVLDTVTGASRVFHSPRAGVLARTPAVSPDGRRIVFQLHRDGVWLLDLKDASMRKILSDPSAEEFAWSPDGNRVAFHSRREGGWGLWVMGAHD